MTYASTRGTVSGVQFSEAVLKGIAPDGGLFVPEEQVRFDSLEIAEMSEMNYKDLAKAIFSRYATDFTEAELDTCVENAYGSKSAFPEAVAPLSYVSDTLSVLELWHGPTSAFKDMALQILPEFMSVALKKHPREDGKARQIAILTATSGDTGKAALEGFKDVDGIRIMVFYPENGVSEMQKYQMITQEGSNVRVMAVRGNFDDAQTGVKKIFTDNALNQEFNERGFELSSANSINIGRLLPQIVYYYYAYFTMVRDQKLKLGTKVNFVVPTGNFGNILACYYAMKSGLPVNRIICATNSNCVVSDFINTGTYDANRTFTLTISPAMDILVSSNLERLLYHASGENVKMIGKVMDELKTAGVYSVDRKTLANISSIFWSASGQEAETMETIGSVYKENQYLIDPHTAVGVNVYDKYAIATGDMTPTVAVSTASPFKFNKSVLQAVSEDTLKEMTEFEMLTVLSEKTGCPIPTPLTGLDQKPVLHKGVCDVDAMRSAVSDFLV